MLQGRRARGDDGKLGCLQVVGGGDVEEAVKGQGLTPFYYFESEVG